MERLFWTDRNCVPVDEELVPMFQEASERGYRPFLEFYDGHILLGGFGIQGDRREAFFVWRGRGWRGRRGTLWEVLLYDAGTIRLGPYFELPEHTCVVVCGIEAVSSVSNCWLDGGEVADVINASRFFNRGNMEALEPPDPAIAD